MESPPGPLPYSFGPPREDVRFSVNFRVGSPDYYALLSGPAGRFRCAPFGIQQGDEAWQRTVSINAPELFLGHQ